MNGEKLIICLLGISRVVRISMEEAIGISVLRATTFSIMAFALTGGIGLKELTEKFRAEGANT